MKKGTMGPTFEISVCFLRSFNFMYYINITMIIIIRTVLKGKGSGTSFMF